MSGAPSVRPHRGQADFLAAESLGGESSCVLVLPTHVHTIVYLYTCALGCIAQGDMPDYMKRLHRNRHPSWYLTHDPFKRKLVFQAPPADATFVGGNVLFEVGTAGTQMPVLPLHAALGRHWLTRPS